MVEGHRQYSVNRHWTDAGGPRGMVDSPTGRRPVRAGRESAPGGALYRVSRSCLVLLIGELPGVDPDRL